MGFPENGIQLIQKNIFSTSKIVIWMDLPEAKKQLSNIVKIIFHSQLPFSSIPSVKNKILRWCFTILHLFPASKPISLTQKTSTKNTSR